MNNSDSPVAASGASRTPNSAARYGRHTHGNPPVTQFPGAASVSVQEVVELFVYERIDSNNFSIIKFVFIRRRGDHHFPVDNLIV